MPIALFSADIIDHYRLKERVLNGYFYMEIRKVMYGLPQAGIFTNKLIKEHLAQRGYIEQPPGSTDVWMISELNMLDTSTFNTFTMR